MRTADRSGLELILPDWFYAGVLNEALVLTIDRAYFDLTGGLERWLYRLVRKHGGRQERRLEFRSCASPRQVRQPLAAQAFCIRPAPDRPAPDAARLPTCHHARPKRRRATELRANPGRSVCRAAAQARSHSSPGGQPVNSARAIGDRNPRAIRDRILVLSGTGIELRRLRVNAFSPS